MNRTTSTAAALGGAFLAASLLATPAQALEPKQCLPMAEMNAALRAEGQRTVIIGDRSTIHDDARSRGGVRVDRFVNTVTRNADGSLGYQLEGDRPRSEPSTVVCVAARLENVSLHDARQPRIPPAAMLGGRFNEVVRENAARGTRPMVVADTAHPNRDGTYRRGLPIVIFGNIAGRSGSMMTAMPDLRPQELALLSNLEYTPFGLSEVAGPALASLQPTR